MNMPTVEERVARVEGVLEGISERLNDLRSRIEGIERRLDGMDTKFTWVIGLILGSWITTILTILFKG